MSKAIVFINGDAPTVFPVISDDDFVLCTDGAYNYLKNFDVHINVLLGDFDSIGDNLEDIKADEVIRAVDQNYTDFQKALQYLLEKGFKDIAVYGGSGKEQDHFLGNLSAALQYKAQLNITFYEDQYRYWFSSKEEKIDAKIDSIISLYPFPTAENIISKGVEYPLNNETLDIHSRIGIRNRVTESLVEITYQKGEMIIFLYH